MDKTYLIDWCEKKETKTGKAVISATLKDESGVTTDKVSIWSDFPNFANIMTGHKVTGNLYTNDKGYKTLYPQKTGTNAPSGNFSPNKGGIKAAQERKAEMIEKAQDRKSESIAYFNSCNLAIATMGANPTHGGFDLEMFKSRRDFFLAEWEKYNDPTNKPAF